MTRFFTWLKTPPSSYWSLAWKGALLAFVYAIVFCVLEWYGFIPTTGDWQGTDDMSPDTFLGFIIVMIVSTPFVAPMEELLFRAPLSLLSRKSPRMVALSSLVLSGLFGYVHGGLATVPVQGVLGILLSLIYLKAGGSTGKFIRPFVVSSVAHILYNWWLLLPIVIGIVMGR